MSYPSSPLSLYLGVLEPQFAPGPLYTFVSLSLMVLYQLESFHLDDYNLIYSQNKNMSFFYKILTAFPLKTQHFPILQTLHKTNPNQQYKKTSIQSQNSFTTKTKLFLSTFGVSPNSNTRTKGFGFISYLSLFKSSLLSCLIS